MTSTSGISTQRKIQAITTANLDGSLPLNTEGIRLLLDSTAVAIYGLDPQGVCTFCNAACVEILGYDNADQIIGRSMHELIHHSHADGTAISVEDCPLLNDLDKKVHSDNHNFWRADGSHFPVEYWSYPIQQGDNTVGLVISFVDITERKRVEKDLHEQKNAYQSILSAAHDGFLVLDIHGRIRDVNTTYLTLSGYDRDELLSMHISELDVYENNEDTFQHINKIVAKGSDLFESEHRRKDGSCWFAEISTTYSPLHGGRFFTFVRDITERKQTEKALIEMRDMRDQSEAIAHVGSWKLDLATNHLAWSDEVYRIFGCEPQSFPASYEVFLDFIHPSDRSAVDTAYTDSLSEGSNFYEIEHRIVRKDNDDVRYVYERCMHKRDAAGTVIQSFGMVQDITEQKNAQEQQLLAQFSIEHTSDSAFWVDKQGYFRFVNTAACQQLGYSREELLQMSVADIDPDWPLEKWPEHFDQLRQHKQLLVETRHRTRDGRILYVEISANYFQQHDREFNFAFVRNVTTRRQSQLALQQKNEELEQFVYSVSHDLKSPLITVKSFVAMLREYLSDSDLQQIEKSLSCLVYIDKAADKMQHLLEDLLHYSRIDRTDISAQTLTAHQSVEECITTLAGFLQQHEVQLSIGEMPQQLHGNPLHFGRIWQNLIENAVKYKSDLSHPHIEIGATHQGHEVVFYVADNGIGIAPEHSTRIFNIFSQLNPGSDGSGLGLALVKKIVSTYQGRIWVESAGEGKGSCFMFTLPGALIKQGPTTRQARETESFCTQ